MARASNPENHPNAKTPPKPAAAEASINDIPSMDAGHGQANFPGYDHASVGGIPVASKGEILTPGYQRGDALDIPGATSGERGQ